MKPLSITDYEHMSKSEREARKETLRSAMYASKTGNYIEAARLFASVGVLYITPAN